MKPIRSVEVIDALEKARKERRGWLFAANGKLPEHQLRAQDAGFEAGWRGAVAFLQQQRAIELLTETRRAT